ncbi:peptidoglycan -binding protein [Roseococcus suduntuyensis]|uniref:Chemotaxis protein MotB n=1 Tax=Roseococcus suduntuyensis TaxID=455361 RepID=A0A840AEK5_9PROT|nr:peptidoglycan -binding protein [Roseococcus suduntuyensis]MBB3898880.1 chemotaxis protein MotB [Roseococcus suduntuyensis]
MARRARRGAPGFDAWPGYVDALSTLLMVIIFALLVFALGQGFLSAALSSRDRALDALNRQVAELAEMLALEEGRARALRGELSAATARAATAEGRARDEAAVAAASREEVGLLVRQITDLRAQLSRLAAALDVADTREADAAARMENLQARLDAALLARVEDLQGYRSEFFGRLSALLGERPEIRVVGDRFVFQSEVLFPTGSADLTPTGQAQLRTLSRLLNEIASSIPPGVNWLLRVDGHADRNPIRSTRFATNWELSAARAIAVVNLLIEAGLPASRVAAAAFGEHQPLDEGTTPEAFARNRRIELRLTDR